MGLTLYNRFRLLRPWVWGFAAILAILLWANMVSARTLSVPQSPSEPPADLAAIHPALARQLAESDEPVSFLVILDEQPDPQKIFEGRGLRTADRAQRAAALYAYLTQFARRSQAPLRAWLAQRQIDFRSFYIINAIEVRGDRTLASALRHRADVNRLAANPLVEFERPPQSVQFMKTEPGTEVVREAQTLRPLELPYGIRYTNAPAVWEMGYRGAGIVVASQDTGVDWQHPALIDHYRGWDPETGTASHAYNWFDAWGSEGRPARCSADAQVPCDDSGHGTHTVGTVLGSDADAAGGAVIVGMAPDAQWIGCRNMKQGAGTPASYTTCFQFFLAPYPQDGDPFVDGEPDKAPHIINNSWYCPPSEGCDYTSLQQVVSTVRAAGQLVVASAGNDGPSCRSVQYPISAYDDVFSVGAHNGTGLIAYFSNRGPVMVDGSGRLKPEIAAPGVDVRSTWVGGGYTSLDGTSMASPHVAGAVALLWSAVPDLIGQLDETEQVLIKSATPVAANECSEDMAPVVPNNTYGYGRLNAAAAVEMALNPGSITLTLRRGEPVPEVQVELVDDLTGYVYRGETNAEGMVGFPRVYLGAYTLRMIEPGSVRTIGVTLSASENVRFEPTEIYLPQIFN